LLDGYPLGSQGYPKTAIACAATASAVGSLFGVVILVALLPMIRPFLLEFGPLERLLVGIWGLLTIISVPTTSSLKAAVMAALGLTTAMIGVDPAMGMPRWDFGSLELSRGFGLVPVLLGVFTFSELITWMRPVQMEKPTVDISAPDDSVFRGVRAVFSHIGLTLRASLIGTLVGMIPGVGGTVAGFVAYGQATQSAKGDTSKFGQGDIRGLIAPEAAVDAKDGGSLLPALAFGLPGSEAGVMLLAVFAVHGIVPGLPMLNAQLPLTFMLIIALLFSNILTSVLGLALTPWLARIKNIRIDRLALPCLIVSLLAIVQLNSQLFDIYTAIGFGIAGYYWRMHDWPRVPFVIAFVLGSLIETNFALTVQLVELGRIVPYERPVSVILMVMIIISMFWLRTRKSKLISPHNKLVSDTVLSLLLSLVTGVLTIVAWLGGASYSGYAKFIVSVTFGLGMVVFAVSSITLWCLEPDGSKNSATLLLGLAPPLEHRLPLVLMLLLMFGIWLTGISIAVGLIALIWFLFRAPNTSLARLYAVLYSCFFAITTYYFINFVANVIVPEGFLWSLLNQ